MSHIFRCFFAAILLILMTGIAGAQPVATEPPNYAAWEEVAAVAERAVREGEGGQDQLRVLRTSLSAYRAQFDNARTQNSSRISLLREQIDVLGEVPAEGEEPREVAERRIELRSQLQALLAPVQVAQEAFIRADGLVGEIDDIVREQQAKRLLSLGSSPLNPKHWPAAFSDMALIMSDIWAETETLSDPVRRQELQSNLPLVLLFLGMALTLVIRGRRWAGKALSFLRGWGGRGTSVWRFLVSLLRIALPLAGLLLLTYALRFTGLVGERVDQILEAIPVWGAFLLGLRWLAERLFSRDAEDALIALSDEGRTQARFYMLVLSIAFVARGVISLLFTLDEVDPATEAVFAFPTVVLISMALIGLGLLLRKTNSPSEDEDDDDQTQSEGMGRALRFAGTCMVAVAIISPVMAAVGYAEAGNAILFPTVVSFALLGVVMSLQSFSADIYGFVTGTGDEGRDALIPVLIGFLLVLASLPILALIWGARVSDLTELWGIFLRGFAVGDTRISPSDFLTFAIIFGAGYAATRVIQSTLRVNVLPKTRIDIGGQNALVSGVGYIGIFLAGLLAITGAGIDLSSIALVAGALSVGIGFGLRTIVENFVSGIILLIGRPISEGDWIEVGGQMGYVRDISVRSTRIETFDRTDVIVPNADLVAGTVTNYTRGNTVGRLTMSIGVAYGTDTRRVSEILKEIATAQPMALANPAPTVIFNNFGADALEFDIRIFLRDVNWIMIVKDEVNHQIAERFAEEGIEVPFAQRDIWLRNPEALKGETS